MPERQRRCEIEGCTRPHLARGLCGAHWARRKRHGDPLGQAPARQDLWSAAEAAQVLDLLRGPDGTACPDRGVERGALAALAHTLGRSRGAVATRLRNIRAMLRALRAARRAARPAPNGGDGFGQANFEAMRAEAKTLRPAGTPATTGVASTNAEMPAPFVDPNLDRPERPCARCRREFQPTVRRRMLCATCFADEDRNLNRKAA